MEHSHGIDRERLLKLLEKIDPSVRLERLKKDQEEIQQRYLTAVLEARLQDRLLAVSTELFGESPTEDEQRTLDEIERQTHSRWTMVRTFHDELEAIFSEQDTAKKIGTRAERRRAQASG